SVQGFGFIAEVWHCLQASVGYYGIRAQNQQEVRSLDVRNRDGDPVPEHEPGGKLFGHLVKSRSGKDVARAQRPAQAGNVQQQSCLMHDGIAQSQRNCIAPASLHDRRQTALNSGKSLCPGGRSKTSVPLDQRRAQPVWIFVQIFKRNALGAEIAAAEDIRLMTANLLHLALDQGKFQTAASLAERANAVVDGFFSSIVHCSRLLCQYGRICALDSLSFPDNDFTLGDRPRARWRVEHEGCTISQGCVMNIGSQLVASGMWRWLQGTGIERFELQRAGEEWIFRGTVLTLDNHAASEARYELVCDDRFHTRRVQVSLRAAAVERVLQITAKDGHWIENSNEN